jgi:hypothetical protein
MVGQSAMLCQWLSRIQEHNGRRHFIFEIEVEVIFQPHILNYRTAIRWKSKSA